MVRTFGKFEVFSHGECISDKFSRAINQWELLKYLIAHDDSAVMPETAVDELWPENDYPDPKRVVRTLAHRINKLIEETTGLEKTIAVSNGCYHVRSRSLLDIDADTFIKCCSEGERFAATDPIKALEQYKRAIALYRGEFLYESAYSSWTIPFRNHYHNSFIRSVATAVALLKESGDHEAIIELCQKASLIDPLEESFHIDILDSMIRQGRKQLAIKHYNYFSEMLRSELGLEPSKKLKELYDIAMSGEVERLDGFDKGKLDLEDVDRRGAMECSIEEFVKIRGLEQRRCKRTGSGALYGKAIFPDGFRRRPEKVRFAVDLLRNSLRVYDIYTLFGEMEVDFLMPGGTNEHVDTITRRIIKSLAKSDANRDGFRVDVAPLNCDQPFSLERK